MVLEVHPVAVVWKLGVACSRYSYTLIITRSKKYLDVAAAGTETRTRTTRRTTRPEFGWTDSRGRVWTVEGGEAQATTTKERPEPEPDSLCCKQHVLDTILYQLCPSLRASHFSIQRR